MTERNFELDWLKRWNLYAPRAVALQDGATGRTLTYRQLYLASLAGAQLLRRRFQLGRGDRVALVATNALDTVVLWFAVTRLNGVLVPLNHRLTGSELEQLIADCEPRVIATEAAFLPALANVPSLAERSLRLDGSEGFIEASHNEPVSEPIAFTAQPGDAAMILYTSGTTGRPKGAVLSHEMLFWNSVNTTLRLNVTQGDCVVMFLPLFHTGGWHVLTTPFLHRGARVVLLNKFDAEAVLRLSERERATLIFGVPTTMAALARATNFEAVDLSSVRYAIVGGEPMPLPLIETWHRKGVLIRQGYGLTEFGPNVFSLNEEDAILKIGSIGFPNFYIDAKVVDEAGVELGVDGVGELALRGPMCMTEYWRNERATHETIKDGWLLTGDLVRRDADGYYFVVGRKKDMFKSGGENVYPPEIEQAMAQCQGVREVAVVGVPDARWGEVGAAFVVRDDPALSTERLLSHCAQRLAKFKIPKRIVFVESLPKSENGKVLKRKLLEPGA